MAGVCARCSRLHGAELITLCHEIHDYFSCVQVPQEVSLVCSSESNVFSDYPFTPAPDVKY